jgi:hypothetical protein
MKKSLYHIEKEYLDLIEALSCDEVTPELEAALSISKEELQVKAINYGFVIKEKEADVDFIASEIKRLTAIKKSEEATIDRLKDAIKTAMILFEIDKVETRVLKLSFRASKSLEIISFSQVPKKFFNSSTVSVLDKSKLKKAIEDGETVDGAIIKENKNLQIK